jgi:4-amino-4-deoxy-L-arabinose transferase-like glycosyltransferase
MQLKVHHYFYLFVSFLFLGIVGVQLFSDGMFMDGLLYAAVSENMANGSGSFWSPHLSDSLMSNFYEHPPLALGLQSIWFYLFGSSFLVERVYSLFTFIAVGFLIVLIWKQITRDKKTGWIPLLLWTSIEVVTWSAANNMLENTMSIFVCFTLFAYLKNKDKNQIIWLVLAGMSIALGFLTKGFFCLYVWSLPFFAWCIGYKTNFKQMVIESTLLILTTALPILLLVALVPAAQENLTQYINHQVLGSIESVQTVDTRFAIIGEFLRNISIPLALALIVWILSKRLNWKKTPLSGESSKLIWLLTAVVLSGIIPIMISLKQRGFYILTVYPLVVIAIALFIYPFVKDPLFRIKMNSRAFKIFKIFTLLTMISAFTICAVAATKVGRDIEMVNDLRIIITETGTNTTIDICPEMRPQWNLHGYYSRYGDITLDYDASTTHLYYLTNGKCEPQSQNSSDYVEVKLKTSSYKLYKCQNPISK